MTDNLKADQRYRSMSGNKSKDTSLELRLAQLLSSAGLRFERNVSELKGKPDFVFRTRGVVVFIDGDFWHGWHFSKWRHKLSPFWREKIQATRVRDNRNFLWLRRRGWKVIRIWEHQLNSDPAECVKRVFLLLGKRISKSRLKRIIEAV